MALCNAGVHLLVSSVNSGPLFARINIKITEGYNIVTNTTGKFVYSSMECVFSDSFRGATLNKATTVVVQLSGCHQNLHANLITG